MIDYIKPTLNFLSYDFNGFAYLICVSLLAAELLLFLITVTVFSFKRSKSDGTYFLCVSLALLLISVYFCVEDYKSAKMLFESVKNVYVYVTLFTVMIIVFYMIVRKLSESRSDKKTVKKQEVVIEEKPPVSNAVKYFKKDDMLNGYLDVGYVKSLINELKQKELSEEDYNQIEEFEIYLLRFITRQPNGEERVVLSEYLSMLIKKLSLYA